MLDGIHVEEKVIHDTGLQKINQGLISVTRHVVLVDFIYMDYERVQTLRLSTWYPRSLSNPWLFLLKAESSKTCRANIKRFGVFTEAGEVLAGHTDFLNQCYAAFQNDPSAYDSGGWPQLAALLAGKPPDVPALQNTGVIGLAYGDHHYQALHADGTITSYGTDSQCCGQLGLGNTNTGAQFRGLFRAAGMGRDAYLIPSAQRHGRQIWFEPEKKDWLASMQGPFAGPLLRMGTNRVAMFSEWVEQEGRHWKDGPQSSRLTEQPDKRSTGSAGYEDLNAYFAITIAAAGWHSGALVLVDDEKAHEIRSKYIKVNTDENEKTMPGAFESRTAEEEYIWTNSGFQELPCLMG